MSVDATKIKVGDKVRLRNGVLRTVENIEEDDHETWPFEILYEGCRSAIEYTSAGRYWPMESDDMDILEIIPASEEKINTKVNLDNLKVGDTIKLADRTMPVVTKIETIPMDAHGYQRWSHRYVVHFLKEDGYEDYWAYRTDGTGDSLDNEQIVEIIPKADKPEEVSKTSRKSMTLNEVLTYGTHGQVYGRRIDGVLQDSKYHITLHTCSLGEKIGFEMKKDIACTLEDIEASDWEFVGYKAAGWHLLI